MRLVMILNQIQAGMGTKDDVKVPLTATKEVIGPGVTLKPLLAEHEQNIGKHQMLFKERSKGCCNALILRV